MIRQLGPRTATFLKTRARETEAFGFWTAAFLSGLAAVAYARIFKLGEGVFLYQLKDNPYVLLGTTPLLFILAWYLVYRFAPTAAGSGIPQIMAAVETPDTPGQKAHTDGLLSLKVAGIKIVSSLMLVVGGGAIGREGPTLQVSACLFYFFALHLRRFLPQISLKPWLVAGASAGLAAAFNTPLGGIVYAIEELGSEPFLRIRSVLLSSVIIAGLVAQWILGPYLFVGYPQLETIEISFIPLAIFCGALTGLAGALFSKMLYAGVQMRKKIQVPWKLAGVAAISGLLMVGISILVPRAAGTGTELFNEFLFRHGPPGLELIVARFFGTMITYLSGAAGGIFSPAMASGATIGAYLAEVFQTHHANLMVLLGMIGFLTGVTRTPFTSFILVLEMTDRHIAIFPMMAAALAAYSAAKLIHHHSFYEEMKFQYLPKEPPVPVSA